MPSRGAQHKRPHFHAYHLGTVGVFAIDDIEMIAGDLDRRERRLVEAWAELHRNELLEDWDLLQHGRLPEKIEPLQ